MNKSIKLNFQHRTVYSVSGKDSTIKRVKIIDGKLFVNGKRMFCADMDKLKKIMQGQAGSVKICKMNGLGKRTTYDVWF